MYRGQCLQGMAKALHRIDAVVTSFQRNNLSDFSQRIEGSACKVSIKSYAALTLV